jgi:hypothetical protein
MEKYLFTDGTNGVREVQSKEELNTLIQSVHDRSTIRIWLFSTNEWISYAEFSKVPTIHQSTSARETPVIATAEKEKKSPLKKRNWIKQALIGLLAALIILLIYNFSRERWEKLPDISLVTPRPANTPPLNMDSLVQVLESTRGQKLDRVTRTNLRIRNTWPDLIQLQLTASHEGSRTRSKIYNVQLVIDNATGYNIDDMEIKLTEWKDKEEISSDTILFHNTGYASPARRSIDGVFKGDSLSATFTSIKSKVFNFCYSSDKKSNYGNLNDRWFCKE